MRLAWFSPMPPVRSGVAVCSARLVDSLRQWHDVDVFVDASRTPPPHGTRSAHEFLWGYRQGRYELCVYQLGNSSVHDYIWPYLFRFPGLTVLHDAHLHHARAALLLRGRRVAEYRAEFEANHPGANADLAELAVAGFDSHLYYYWPMRRLAVERSRLSAVHSESLARQLRQEMPDASVEAVRLGHGEALGDREATAARARVRAHHRIPGDALVVGIYGGLSPDKRVAQVIAAFAATRHLVPSSYLLLVGGIPDHYDPRTDVQHFELQGRAIVTGYVDSDEELTAYIAACDIAFNLRWPTAREVSGPWLRCLALGKPTVVFQLAHLGGVPALDPRTWSPVSQASGSPVSPPICVAVDILDEDHSLRLAIRRLAQDHELRDALGRAAKAYWHANHDPALMVDDYRRIIELARERPVPSAPLPPHLLQDAASTLQEVLAAFEVADPLR